MSTTTRYTYTVERFLIKSKGDLFLRGLDEKNAHFLKADSENEFEEKIPYLAGPVSGSFYAF